MIHPQISPESSWRKEDHSDFLMKSSFKLPNLWLHYNYGGYHSEHVSHTAKGYLHEYFPINIVTFLRYDPRNPTKRWKEPTIIINLDFKTPFFIPYSIFHLAYEKSLGFFKIKPKTTWKLILSSAKNKYILKCPISILFLIAQQEFPLDHLTQDDIERTAHYWSQIYPIFAQSEKIESTHSYKKQSPLNMDYHLKISREKLLSVAKIIDSQQISEIYTYVEEYWRVEYNEPLENTRKFGWNAKYIRDPEIEGLKEAWANSSRIRRPKSCLESLYIKKLPEDPITISKSWIPKVEISLHDFSTITHLNSILDNAQKIDLGKIQLDHFPRYFISNLEQFPTKIRHYFKFFTQICKSNIQFMEQFGKVFLFFDLEMGQYLFLYVQGGELGAATGLALHSIFTLAQKPIENSRFFLLKPIEEVNTFVEIQSKFIKENVREFLTNEQENLTNIHQLFQHQAWITQKYNLLLEPVIWNTFSSDYFRIIVWNDEQFWDELLGEWRYDADLDKFLSLHTTPIELEEYCQKMKREFFGSEEHPLVQEILGDGYEEEKDWDEEEYEDEEEEEELDNKDDLDVMKDEEI